MERRNRFLMLNLAVIAVCSVLLQAPARADQSEIEYDTQTGYIRAIRTIPTSPAPAAAPMAPRASRAAAPAAAPATSPSTPGILVVQHPPGSAPDSIQQKIDLGSFALIANDRLTPSMDVIVMPAGSGETRSLEITKCAASGTCRTGDTSQVWITLVAMVNGERALPGTRFGATPPKGRIISMPVSFSGGRCTVILRAAERPGEDVLMIAQKGLEAKFVSVRYE